MKQSLTFFLILCLTITACRNAPTDCQRFRNGTYKLSDAKFGTYTIVRSDAWQLETKEGDTDTSTFAVKWLDDCTYTLTPYASFFKKFPSAPKNEVLTVSITKTTPNSYFTSTTSNTSSYVSEAELVRVK